MNTLRKIKRFFINLFIFRKLLWEHVSWDYSSVYLAMKLCIDDMEKNQRKYGNHLNKDKACDKMRIMSHCLRRLYDSDYTLNKCSHETWTTPCEETGIYRFHIASTKNYDLPSADTKSLIKLGKSMKELDKEIVCKMFKQNLEGWWD